MLITSIFVLPTKYITDNSHYGRNGSGSASTEGFRW